MDQISSSIYRVQDPEIPAPVNSTVILLFSHKLYLWIHRIQALFYQLLHLDIHLCHIIAGSFFFYLGYAAAVCKQRLHLPY